MRNPGNGSKEEIISHFGKYVSSGKADFFKGVGIDFVFGSREGPDLEFISQPEKTVCLYFSR